MSEQEYAAWDGATYGTLGSLGDDGTHVQCHCCGNRYRTLARHILIAHNLTPAEYRALFGLNKNTGLCSAAYSEIVAERQRRRLPEVMAKLAKAREIMDATPREQRRAWAQQTLRQEARGNMSAAKGGMKTGYCVVCGKPHTMHHAERKKTCGPECRRIRKREIALSQGLGGKRNATPVAERGNVDNHSGRN